MTIHECTVETFRAGGKGGQNQNKRDTGCRVRHLPSGAIGTARDGRSQLLNKRKAFERMARSPEFRRWAHREASSGIPVAPLLVNINPWPLRTS